MKIGIFTDPHYSSQEVTCGKRYNSRSLDKIRQAYAHFGDSGCELVICLGDLTDRESEHGKERENLKAAARVIRDSGIPTVCLMGNHDAFCFTQEEFYQILGDDPPSAMTVGENCLLFLDACYFESGKRYGPGDSDWTDTFLLHIEQLEEGLRQAQKPVTVFIHQNLDPEIRADHRLRNADAVNRLLHDSGKVRRVYQGHYHPGHRSCHEGIDYITFPAMCEKEGAWFVEEL